MLSIKNIDKADNAVAAMPYWLGWAPLFPKQHQPGKLFAIVNPSAVP
jgi:hypothetical protein